MLVSTRATAGAHRPPFRGWEGGGEYNVARGLRKCFGMRTAVVTALADNDIGRLVEDFILQGGVDTSLIRWTKYDGIGRDARNGLNFTERGFGVRGALGVSDRGHTASPARPATSTGTTCSASSAFAGSTPAASLPRCRTRPPKSPKRPCSPRAGTAPSSPTTSTTAQSLAGFRWAGARTRREPAYRAARRRVARQRRGLHRRAWDSRCPARRRPPDVARGRQLHRR